MAEQKKEESDADKIGGFIAGILFTAIAVAVGSAFKKAAAIYERVKDPTHPRHGLVHTIYTIPGLGIGFGLLLAVTLDDPSLGVTIIMGIVAIWIGGVHLLGWNVERLGPKPVAEATLLAPYLYPFDQERPPPLPPRTPDDLPRVLRLLPESSQEALLDRAGTSIHPSFPLIKYHYDDIVLGTAVDGGFPIPLTAADQGHHGLVWGSTGAGKSMFLLTQILQHISRHHAVCLLDPHGDLSTDCLRHLAAGGFFNQPDAYERLVYIDFSEDRHAPFNVLSTRFRPHTRAMNALEAFTRTWPEIQNAPHFRTLFLSSAMILIANGLPLTDINRLLLDDDFRHSCLARVQDPLVRQVSAFFEKGPGGQAGSTLRRSFLLGFSPVIRGCLAQTDNVFDMRRMMDSGVSLIVNLGSIEQMEVRRLMGSLLMVQIEQAALSRSDLPPATRRPWTCFVDEWPQMAATQGESLDNMLTQARKYNLRLQLAGQSPAQIDSGRLAGALEQCRMSVTFRLGAESAKKQSQELTLPIMNNPEYSPAAQARVLSQTIQNLPSREAIVRVASASPKHINTLTVTEPTVEPQYMAEVLEIYRSTYQRRAAPSDLFSDVFAAPLRAGDVLRMEAVLRDVGGPVADFDSYFGEALADAADDTRDT